MWTIHIYRELSPRAFNMMFVVCVKRPEQKTASFFMKIDQINSLSRINPEIHNLAWFGLQYFAPQFGSDCRGFGLKFMQVLNGKHISASKATFTHSERSEFTLRKCREFLWYFMYYARMLCRASGVAILLAVVSLREPKWLWTTLNNNKDAYCSTALRIPHNTNLTF